MKTSVCQSLVDDGDPLALAMVADGAETFNLVPVSEWRYVIYKVTYLQGDIKAPEDQSRVVQVLYLLSSDNAIEDDSGRFGPNTDWFKWEVLEANIKIPKKRGDYGFSESYGYGSYKTVAELKADYRI